VTKVIILCAGDGTRWGDFRGVPKHLVEIEGQRLIDRTCSQFLSYTNDVVVVAPKDDDRYLIPNTTTYIPKEFGGRELEKFYSSMDEWSTSERTVLVYGDVYFTDEAVETIMTNSDSWKYFCRSTPSDITGKNCKEIFAIGFMPEKREWMVNSVMSILDLKSSTGGWSLFRLLTGNVDVSKSDMSMFNTGNHVEINDWTEDFDYPVDLETWEHMRKLHQTPN
jgi:hypothetical protein